MKHVVYGGEPFKRAQPEARPGDVSPDRLDLLGDFRAEFLQDTFGQGTERGLDEAVSPSLGMPGEKTTQELGSQESGEEDVLHDSKDMPYRVPGH